MLNRRTVLLGAAALLCLGLAVLWQNRHREEPAHTTPVRTVPKPAPKPVAAARPLGPSATAAKPSPATPTAVPATSPQPGRSAAEWRELLAGLAPEGYEARHPGVLARLADLMLLHPGDISWEAGAVAYLIEENGNRPPLSLWRKAAEAFPSNPAVSDAMVRAALDTSTLPPEDMENLLKTQTGRFPKDPHLLWLRAGILCQGAGVSVSFQEGRGEEALDFLKAASALPPWEDWTGVAQTSSLDVQEALEGPLPEFGRALKSSSILLPEFGRTQKLTRASTNWADALRAQGDPAKAREILEQARAMGQGMQQGNRTLIQHLVANSVESQTQKKLQALCVATGDVPGAEAAARRIEEIQAEGQAVRRWIMNCCDGDSSGISSPAMQAYESLKDLSEEERIRAAENLLSPEEKARCREFSSGGELAAFRAWLQRQPKQP